MTKFVRRTLRNYEVILAICGGKTVGVAVAVIEDGVATWTSGTATWPQIRKHLTKIDIMRGVHEQALEKDYTSFYLSEAKAAGCLTNIRAHYNKTLLLEFPTRKKKAEQELLDFLGTLPIKVKKHYRRFDIAFLERMRTREGEIVGGGHGKTTIS